jgi:hypothetical protein
VQPCGGGGQQLAHGAVLSGRSGAGFVVVRRWSRADRCDGLGEWGGVTPPSDKTG